MYKQSFLDYRLLGSKECIAQLDIPRSETKQYRHAHKQIGLMANRYLGSNRRSKTTTALTVAGLATSSSTEDYHCYHTQTEDSNWQFFHQATGDKNIYDKSDKTRMTSFTHHNSLYKDGTITGSRDKRLASTKAHLGLTLGLPRLVIIPVKIKASHLKSKPANKKRPILYRVASKIHVPISASLMPRHSSA